MVETILEKNNIIPVASSLALIAVSSLYGEIADLKGDLGKNNVISRVAQATLAGIGICSLVKELTDKKYVDIPQNNLNNVEHSGLMQQNQIAGNVEYAR